MDNPTSKDVFAKRRSGSLDEAYEMAKALIDEEKSDDWNIRAIAWCLIDLIKREAKRNNTPQVKDYLLKLNELDVPNDEILLKQINFVKKLENQKNQLIEKAKTKSKEGDHNEALKIYEEILSTDPRNQKIKESIGWELYHLSKTVKVESKKDVTDIKKIILKYLKLNTERPSLLHSKFLLVAKRIIFKDNFNIINFLKNWDVRNLRDEDFEPYENLKTGKSFPSIAEYTIKKAIKQALRDKDTDFIKKSLNTIDKLISYSEDSFWLEYYKTKCLFIIGKPDEAIKFATKIVKQKINDFWSWELLGDIQLELKNDDNAFSCYCKALIVNSDEKFIQKVRLKVARYLIEKEDFSAAKYEIENIAKNKLNNGYKIPDEVLNIKKKKWYLNTEANKDNSNLYINHVELAELLLFDDIDWIDGCIGDSYTLKGKPGKVRRNIYIKQKDSVYPLEISIAENKIQHININNGEGVKIKGEFTDNNHFMLYRIEEREFDLLWDIFCEDIGIIDHVNHNKKLIHFIVDKEVDSLIYFEYLDKQYKVGDTIAVLLSEKTSSEGKKYKAVHFHETDKSVKDTIVKNFNEKVSVKASMLGFTESNILIDRNLVSNHGIEDGDIVCGVSVLNYNKKRNEWGWKALDIEKVAK